MSNVGSNSYINLKTRKLLLTNLNTKTWNSYFQRISSANSPKTWLACSWESSWSGHPSSALRRSARWFNSFDRSFSDDADSWTWNKSLLMSFIACCSVDRKSIKVSILERAETYDLSAGVFFAGKPATLRNEESRWAWDVEKPVILWEQVAAARLTTIVLILYVSTNCFQGYYSQVLTISLREMKNIWDNVI